MDKENKNINFAELEESMFDYFDIYLYRQSFITDDLLKDCIYQIVEKMNSEGYDFSRQMVMTSKTLDPDKIFGNINDVIEYLNTLKTEGVEEVEGMSTDFFGGFEIRGFCKEPENNHDYIKRVLEDSKEYIQECFGRIGDEHLKDYRIRKIKEKIKAMEAELKALTNNFL